MTSREEVVNVVTRGVGVVARVAAAEHGFVLDGSVCHGLAVATLL
jgi:hypothetical protein